ncbi:MAG: hypothetical protein ABJF04_16130 [Reichenbachiella sp.]|uniref:hypothetical protein n=1 Tax=Reichenbachiella sp. TaxID=2184521 RepID=UPI0032679B0F
MSVLKKTALGLSIVALTAFGVRAQSANQLAFNDNPKAKTALAEKKVLNAPVVQEHSGGSGRAFGASFDDNIAVHVFHGKNDPISGYRYAKGFANGFASREKTGNKPIYVTATFQDGAYSGPTFVNILIDGEEWEFEGEQDLSPQLAGKLLPTIMNDYVREHGHGKIIPEDQNIVMVASLN